MSDPARLAMISARGAPTFTSSSTSTRSLVTVPLAGAGTSASTLSVETSTTVSPSEISSPSDTCHSSTVPSVTDSPISGITICRAPSSVVSPALTEASSLVAGRIRLSVRVAHVRSPRPHRLHLLLRLAPSRRGRVSLSRRSSSPPAEAPLGPGSSSARAAPTLTSSSTSTRSLRDRAAGRRRDLGVDLVGRDLDHGLALLDHLPLGDVPLEHGALGHRLAHLRHLDLDVALAIPHLSLCHALRPRNRIARAEAAISATLAGRHAPPCTPRWRPCRRRRGRGSCGPCPCGRRSRS